MGETVAIFMAAFPMFPAFGGWPRLRMMQEYPTMTENSDSSRLHQADALDASDLAEPAPLLSRPDVALFLDFDGTLVEIAEHPDRISVAPDLPQLLTRLSRLLCGRLAVVSGRSLSALDRFLGEIDVAMSGSHGGEFRAAGSDEVIALSEPFPEHIARELANIAVASGDLLLETKPYSAAIHYRDLPSAGPALIARAGELAQSAGLDVKAGKMVVELAMPGSNKGNAVSHFMKLPEFRGTHPLFVGDDVTDEDAFAAVTPLGGGGILVGPPRKTAALWRLADVAAVYRWLEAALPEQTSREAVQ